MVTGLPSAVPTITYQDSLTTFREAIVNVDVLTAERTKVPP
jgi:hypothetical protein